MEERKLPVFDLEGTGFYVDLVAEEFRQVENERNRISFDVFGVHKNGYVLRYDTVKLNAWIGPKGSEPSYVKPVFVPFKSKLDPVGLARQQGFPDDYYSR